MALARRPMREALARVDVPAVVAIFRAASGLSQLELGNLIEGWSPSLVSLTERGLRDTLCDIRRLLAFADTVGMPRAALAPLILGHPVAILECDSIVALQGVDTVDLGRREFSFLAAGLAAAAVLPMPDRVDRAHLRYLQAVLTRLRTQDDTVGGGAVLPQALRDLAPRDQANYRALLSGTLMQAGNLNQAIDHGLMILPELGTTLAASRVLQRLRPVRDAASAAAAAEFCERFDAAARALRAT